MNYPDKKPTSPRKIAANQANSKKSTGPKTQEGKERSSQNAFRHGFFAKRLFPSNELFAKDGADYNMVFAGLCSHYAPVGFLERLWVERIATESTRLARVLEHGQKVLGTEWPFETRSIDKLLRYENTVTRNLANAMKTLERLQAERLASAPQTEETGDLEADEGDIEPEPTPPQPSPGPCLTSDESGPSANETASEPEGADVEDLTLLAKAVNPEPSTVQESGQEPGSLSESDPRGEICERDFTCGRVESEN
jgi:hypothetical protein